MPWSKVLLAVGAATMLAAGAARAQSSSAQSAPSPPDADRVTSTPGGTAVYRSITELG